MFPLNASPYVDLSLPSVQAAGRNEDGLPMYTSASQFQLPPTCFLRKGYDRLRASISEAIDQDLESSPEIYLPNKDSLNTFIEAYFENFSPLFPILPPAGFVADTEHFLLILCVSAIGASFLAETELKALHLMRSLLQKCLDNFVRLLKH